MASPLCERAIGDAVRFGHAVLRFISAIDVGLIGSHPWGYYLSKSDDMWSVLTPQKPEKGLALDQRARIVRPNGCLTLRTSNGCRRMAGGCSSPGSARFGNPRRL